MTLAACAERVRRGDPDRFLAAMAAPPEARAVLFALYAFNLEVARAPWVTAEPLIAAMRLQWWRDALDEIAAGGAVRAHEVTGPLAEAVRARGVPLAPLEGLVAARHRDIDGAPFADEAALWVHLDATAGGLMWAGAAGLGAPRAAEVAVRGLAAADGLARWFLAVPALEAHGHAPLPDPSADAVAALARAGLARLTAARGRRALVPAAARPALLAGWRAGPILARAAAEPGLVAAGGLEGSDFARRGGLVWRALTGRW